MDTPPIGSKVHVTAFDCFECGGVILAAHGGPLLPNQYFDQLDKWKFCPLCGSAMIGYRTESEE